MMLKHPGAAIPMTDKATSSTNSSTCSSPGSLTRARMARALKRLDEQLRTRCGYSEESARYWVKPSRVTSLRSNAPTSSGK